MSFRTVRHFIRKHRSDALVSSVATVCQKFLRAYYNEDFYELDKNGEKSVIERVSHYFRNDNLFVLDIGANKGDWACAVLNQRPDARIFCFEIVPTTARALSARFAAILEVRVYDFGLSDGSGDVDVYLNKKSDDTAAIWPPNSNPPFGLNNVERIRCKVEEGDSVIEKLGISRIDLMKIDVEGHEFEVLKGFGGVLSRKTIRPAIIQFEYGATYIPSHHSLYEIYQLLEPNGYAIGRIYPDGVEFKKYAFADDHFRMGNYVAVQAKSDFERLLHKF